MSRVVESFVPRRLGTSFRWLLASSWVSSLGDGIALAAGPLLVASLTSDPLLVASAVLLQQLPWLLLGLYAGALADRLDRRLVVVAVDLVRVLVLSLLALSVVTGSVSIAVVLVSLLVLGTAEVFADNASGTLVPSLVRRDDLTVANSRVMTGYLVLNQMAGPALGALLFSLAAATPFVAQAALVGLGVAALTRVRVPAHGREHVRTHLRQDIGEGLRWVRHHAAVRTLVVTIFVFNITYGAAWSVLVLYARERLGLGEAGYGLLTSVLAVGGVVGSASYGAITRHVSLGDLMRVGLVIETLTHLALALTTSAALAFAVFAVFGAHAFVWGTTSLTVRQRAVPTSLQGRVGSVNSLGTYGGLVAGAGIGGLIAQRYGVTAPFWFAFGGSAVFVVAIWRQLSHVAHGDAPPPTA